MRLPRVTRARDRKRLSEGSLTREVETYPLSARRSITGGLVFGKGKNGTRQSLYFFVKKKKVRTRLTVCHMHAWNTIRGTRALEKTVYLLLRQVFRA